MKEFSLEKLSGARDRDRPRTNLRRRLKVLILHSNNHLPEVRRTSFNHAFCLLKYAPWNSYELHAFGEPISQRLRHERYDAIITDIRMPDIDGRALFQVIRERTHDDVIEGLAGRAHPRLQGVH